MVCQIKMKTTEDAVRVSREAAKAGIDMTVLCGSSMIDPRSLLGLFNFVGKDAKLVAPDNTNPQVHQKLVKRMGVIA